MVIGIVIMIAFLLAFIIFLLLIFSSIVKNNKKCRAINEEKTQLGEEKEVIDNAGISRKRIFIYVGLVLTVLLFFWLSGPVLLMLAFSFDAPRSSFFDSGFFIRLLMISPLILLVGIFVLLCKKLNKLSKTEDMDNLCQLTENKEITLSAEIGDTTMKSFSNEIVDTNLNQQQVIPKRTKKKGFSRETYGIIVMVYVLLSIGHPMFHNPVPLYQDNLIFSSGFVGIKLYLFAFGYVIIRRIIILFLTWKRSLNIGIKFRYPFLVLLSIMGFEYLSLIHLIDIHSKITVDCSIFYNIVLVLLCLFPSNYIGIKKLKIGVFCFVGLIIGVFSWIGYQNHVFVKEVAANKYSSLQILNLKRLEERTHFNYKIVPNASLNIRIFNVKLPDEHKYSVYFKDAVKGYDEEGNYYICRMNKEHIGILKNDLAWSNINCWNVNMHYNGEKKIERRLSLIPYYFTEEEANEIIRKECELGKDGKYHLNDGVRSVVETKVINGQLFVILSDKRDDYVDYDAYLCSNDGQLVINFMSRMTPDALSIDERMEILKSIKINCK